MAEPHPTALCPVAGLNGGIIARGISDRWPGVAKPGQASVHFSRALLLIEVQDTS